MNQVIDEKLAKKIPASVISLMKKFQKGGFEIYLVGGGVRDLLLGKKITNPDFTTSATPEEIQKLLPNSYYDNSFGTVCINVTTGQVKEIFEITTYRTEKNYSDKRHPDVVNWGKTLEEDLQRRDFTMNAMAIGWTSTKLQAPRHACGQVNSKQILKTKFSNIKQAGIELIDLFGGQRDLENEVIRAVGDANKRFSEDALRLMRAIRFASQLGFTIEENTFKAIAANAQLLGNIAAERVRDELFKILVSEFPVEGVTFLYTTGLLNYIIPELTKSYGVEQARHHIYDVWNHSLQSLKNCPSMDPVVKLAALIHDIGKPYVVSDTGPVRTFYNHELVSARIAKDIAKRLRLSNEQADKLWHLVRYHQFTVDEKQTDSALRRFIRNVTKEYLNDMLDLRTGDRLGGGAKKTSWRLEEFKARLVEVQKQPFTVADLKVSGNDVMKILGIKPGPKVGQVLDAIFSKVETEEISNEREIQLDEIQKVKIKDQNQM